MTCVNIPQILERSLHLLLEELDVREDVLVIELPLLDVVDLLHHLALHHRDAVLLHDLTVVGLLDQVLKREKEITHINAKRNSFQKKIREDNQFRLQQLRLYA